MLRLLALLALTRAVKLAVPPASHSYGESTTAEMLKEALAGRGIEWQFDEMEVDNDLVELMQTGPNMTRDEATAQLTHMEGGPLILAEMHEIDLGRVSKADTVGADLFLKLMKSSLTKKQNARMRLNHQHRVAVEGFVKRLTKLVSEIDATSTALTKTLAKRSEAWVKLKKNERLQKAERLKFQEQQRYHRYAMWQMKKDKASLERTQRLLGEGYNNTCPNGFFMLLQKCGHRNRLNAPQLIQAMKGLSPALRVHVQSDIAKRFGVPVEDLSGGDEAEDKDAEKDVEHDREMNKAAFANTMSRLEDERNFDTDDILAEEAASVEEGDSSPTDVQLVEHNVLMSDVERQLDQDERDVTLLQLAGEPANDIIYPNCTAPKCDVLKPVVKEIDDDLQNSIDSLIRQISAKQKRWARRCAQNKALNEQYANAILLNTQKHQAASLDFAKYNKEKVDYLKRLKKLYKEMSSEQRTWTDAMTTNRNDMCAIIMFRDSAVKALKKPKIIDCLMTKWKRSSSCTKECGGGVSIYNRRILMNASNEGVECPRKCLNASWDGKSMADCTQTEVLKQKTVICNTHICPTDCQMNPWSSFSKCRSNGKSRKGIQTRTRSIGINEANKGLKCGVLQEDKSCFMVGGKYARCKARQWLAAGKIRGDRQRYYTPGGPKLLKGLWQINYESAKRAGCKRKPTEPKPIYKNLTKMKCTMGQYDGCSPLLDKEKFEKLSWNHDATHWIQAANGQTLNNMPKMVEQLKNPAPETDYVIGCNSKGKIAGDKSGHFKFIGGFEVNINNNSFTQLEVGCTKPEKMTAGMGKCYRGPVFSLVGDRSKGWIVKWGWCKSSYYLTNFYALASEKDKAFLTAVRHVQCCQRGWPPA